MKKYEEQAAAAGEEQAAGGKSTKKKSLGRELMEDIILVCIVLVTVFFLKNYILLNAVIPSGSMENTISIKDRIFGNRLAYRNHDPERGDIVIFEYPDDESVLYIKRVIGLPGDTVDIRDGKVYINGSQEPLDEPYLPEPMNGSYGPYHVPEGCFFMLGDNRNYSKDSRLWNNPYVTREEIQAKAVFRYFPFNRMGRIG